MKTADLLLCCSFVVLVLSSVASTQDLNTTEDLRNTSFGMQFPRHGLMLLLWFADNIGIDQNNVIQPLYFRPDQGVYGFHYYANYEYDRPELECETPSKMKLEVKSTSDGYAKILWSEVPEELVRMNSKAGLYKDNQLLKVYDLDRRTFGTTDTKTVLNSGLQVKLLTTNNEVIWVGREFDEANGALPTEIKGFDASLQLFTKDGYACARLFIRKTFTLFSLEVPGGSLLASRGSSVLLPCGASPSLNVKSYEVRWHRPNRKDNPILLYKDLKVQENAGEPRYRGRVSLVGDLQKGNVSLKLENLTLADGGEYVCYVKSIQWYDSASVNLNITVVGLSPLLSIAEAGDELNVTCESDGWSPEPTLTWRDKRGRKLINSAVHYETDSEGLVRVRSWLKFSPSESEWLSCSVEMTEGRVLPLPLKPAPAINQESTYILPGWKKAFLVSLVVTLLVLTVMALLIVPKTKVWEKIDKETNTEKEVPDWEKMTGCKVAIRPDASTATFLEVGKKKSRVTCKSDVREKTGFVHVLCEERIRSGQYYWEITALTEPYNTKKPGDKYECPSSWSVGVTSEAAEKKSRVPLNPQYGYWVLHYDKERGYYVNDPSSENLTPVLVRDRFSKLGVFLDCEKNKLSFYDCDKKSHLYTFYNVDSTEPLIPVLSPGEKLQHTLGICQEKCVNCDELYRQPDRTADSL
ncbi:butyrophilin subfamily 1 member A1-like [Salminus brasiliensis]|uniref:butyrophilin subfamily 1 member A1-like n=1 Tax=Salminus brasiliensis TaxID=930266 RepID=UPI003B83039E